MEYRVSKTLFHSIFAHTNGDIFDSLILKQVDKNELKTSLGGIGVIDTEDYYEDVKKLYPEDDAALATRVAAIMEHYKGKHAQNKGKSVAYVITTHAGIIKDL